MHTLTHVRLPSSLQLTDDNRIVTGSIDQTIRVWFANTGQCQHVLRGLCLCVPVCVCVFVCLSVCLCVCMCVCD